MGEIDISYIKPLENRVFNVLSANGFYTKDHLIQGLKDGSIRKLDLIGIKAIWLINELVGKDIEYESCLLIKMIKIINIFKSKKPDGCAYNLIIYLGESEFKEFLKHTCFTKSDENYLGFLIFKGARVVRVSIPYWFHSSSR